MKRVNKKGFTLVELLAVIVILALLMAVAVTSMGGVLNNSRRNTTRSTAGQIIASTRLELTSAYLTGYVPNGIYVFTNEIVDSGGIDNPLGGKIVYYDTTKGGAVAVPNSRVVYKVGGNNTQSHNVETISGQTAAKNPSVIGALAAGTTTAQSAKCVANLATVEVTAGTVDQASYVVVYRENGGDITSTSTKYSYGICLKSTALNTIFFGEENDILSSGGFFSDTNATATAQVKKG